jgi:hypothetical protein
VTVTQSDLKALDSDDAAITDALRFCQLTGLFREEQLMTAFLAASPLLL